MKNQYEQIRLFNREEWVRETQFLSRRIQLSRFQIKNETLENLKKSRFCEKFQYTKGTKLNLCSEFEIVGRTLFSIIFGFFLSVITICIILRQTFHGNGQTPHFGDLSHTCRVLWLFSCTMLNVQTAFVHFCPGWTFVLSACFFFFFHPILLSFLRPASMEKQIFISFCSAIFIFYLFGR